MKFKYLVYLYIFAGVIEILLIGFHFNLSIYLRPVCVFLIYSFYVANVKKHNYFLLFYLTCELINEVFFLIDFSKYFVLVLTCYCLATFSMLYHIWPLVKRTSFKTNWSDLIRPFLGLLGILFIFWELILMVFKNLPNFYIFFPALVALLVWIFFCSIMPAKDKHPDNFALYFIGGSMAVMAPTMFIYEFLWSNSIILYLSLISMFLLKIFLVWYLINLDKILCSKEEYF
ncbi:hypothetical protein DSM03_102248 [Leeuwenhoekiella aestuarii]|uniref:YhhN-like protein n=1 Tax=Leeuwenhoekiella aestuarii TaxID=2249426 RepID=A0A4Q0NUW9_9FLAO|nr:hypothetical protein DSM04_103410 [Leeuwenhoekiella aestuarii]RXG17372.1 hypothetical protein DSM03_102248 [Leeuwenhoekiella aestuarii]